MSTISWWGQLGLPDMFSSGHSSHALCILTMKVPLCAKDSTPPGSVS